MTFKASHLGAHAAIVVVRWMQSLPRSWMDAAGSALGTLLWWFARSRKSVALINLGLCFPELTTSQREDLAREHFTWIGRSILDRGTLWFATEARLRQTMHLRGAVHLAAQSQQPVMWLLPHFVGLEWAAPALLLGQTRPVVDVYQPQSNPVFDAQILQGRKRFGRTELVERDAGIRPVMRWMRQGHGFVNAPDMDFGTKDSAFVPFFGLPACTLLAPARLAESMQALVQPVIITMLPQGRGVDVWFADPIPHYPSGDAVADAATFNAWLETQVRTNPAQYFWVHKRFKTRPPGQTSWY